MSVYEYRTLRIERASWPRLTADVFGATAAATREAGGGIFLLCAGVIGFAADEGVLIRAWPDADTMAARAAAMLAADAIVCSSMQAVTPTVRPKSADAPVQDGVYAHRWFWVHEPDVPEFIRLSEDGVWPYFEAVGCRIVGLWRAPAKPRDLVPVLLITRYDSVSHWERTRLQSPEPPPGVDAALYRSAQAAVRRRAALTRRSIVRLTRPVFAM